MFAKYFVFNTLSCKKVSSRETLLRFFPVRGDGLAATVIPHTFRNTTLGGYRPGARVNLETDILAKHVEKLLRRLDLKQPLTVDHLREQGY